MNAIRIEIHLKYFFDDNSAVQIYNFWYAFQPSKLSTIKDILKDIRMNYIKSQLSLFADDNDNDERSLIIYLDDCQLLPFTSSEILRDNDRLVLMPIAKYRLHKKSLQESINLNVSSSMIIESTPSVITTVSETNHKRQRIESDESKHPTESTIALIPSTANVEEQARKKKTKTTTKPIDDQISPTSIEIQSPIVEPTAQLTIEKEIRSNETSASVPSTNGRIRELKSKTPAWKVQTPAPRADPQNKVHIRFDSDSDEESSTPHPQAIIDENKSVQSPLSQSESISKEKRTTELIPHTDASNNSVHMNDVSASNLTQTDIMKMPEATCTNKKTGNLLFEMKQHKNPQEKLGKRIQQQYGRKRAQNRKRALDYFSMANFLDQAFGLNKEDLEKQITSSNGYHTSSASQPQILPTSFSKLARLPLIAEAIDDNEKMYDLYPPLTQCPSVQTRIAFKLLELNEDFCPTMSTFKQGTIIEVNSNQNELTIELDKPFRNVFDQPSKFYAPNENDIEQTSNTMTALFSDLNSVRLLPPVNI